MDAAEAKQERDLPASVTGEEKDDLGNGHLILTDGPCSTEGWKPPVFPAAVGAVMCTDLGLARRLGMFSVHASNKGIGQTSLLPSSPKPLQRGAVAKGSLPFTRAALS